MHVELLILQSLTENPLNVLAYTHTPAPEQSLKHVFDGVKHFFCVELQSCHTPHSLFSVHEALEEGDAYDKAAACATAHISLLAPCVPINAPPGKQGPHVCDLEEHGSR